jgi:plasmid maintenance system antidote protein VapI
MAVEVIDYHSLRLAEYFQMSPEFWMNLQHRYDLDRAKIDLEADLSVSIHPCAYLNKVSNPDYGLKWR